MKVVLALSCMAVAASAMPYPMAYPQPMVYYPEPLEALYRVPRQADLATAADTGYGAPAGPVGISRVECEVCSEKVGERPLHQ